MLLTILKIFTRLISIILTPKFTNKPKNLRLKFPFKVSNSNRIYIGSNVYIGSNSTLNPLTKGEHGESYDPKIKIGNNVSATANLQIHCVEKIEIEDDVLIAANVFIVDCSHGYETVSSPFKNQPLTHIGSVKIGKGSWIGQNVVILQGVEIGIMSIIGANSVINKSIPPFCIAVGNPAKVIKKWNEYNNT